MNIVDLIIILLVIFAIVRGIHTGLLQLLFSSSGLIGGLLLGSWLAPIIAVHISDPVAKLLAVIVTVIVAICLLTTIGQIIGQKLSERAGNLHLGKLNQLLGAGLEVAFLLLAVWLLASGLTNILSSNIGSSIQRSLIVQKLDAALPPPPDAIARLEKIINPNGFPNVFLGLEPQHGTIKPTNSVNSQAIISDEKSVVKVEGLGCGGIVSGSGFVASTGIVVTNAHVVAGIARPKVVDGTNAYQAVPIWFDPNLDIAILRVNRLTDPVLPLSNQILPNDDAAAVLGYPGGGPLVENQAAIIDHIDATGRNIYNQGTTQRNIYEIQANVQPGDSGGTLLAPDGSVAGIVFAKSVSQNNVGYALLINQVKSIISRAERQNTIVGTGSCASD